MKLARLLALVALLISVAVSVGPVLAQQPDATSGRNEVAEQEILDRLADGSPLPGDTIRLQDVGWTMTDASLCGLGQTAASAVFSAMKRWPHLFENGVADHG